MLPVAPLTPRIFLYSTIFLPMDFRRPNIPAAAQLCPPTTPAWPALRALYVAIRSRALPLVATAVIPLTA